MRFASLGSGSRGNATLVESGRTCLLIDCGFSARETERRLARAGRQPADIDGILVTHEHSDHLGGVSVFARRHRLTVWMTSGTRREFERVHDGAGETRIELISSHESFAVGDLEVHPYPVPHDAREPAQFVFGDGQWRFGLLTDAGRPTEHMGRQLAGCHAIMLESNHDSAMLQSGPYPPRLKARVGGALGHLSNDQAAVILSAIDGSVLQHVVAAHISEKNNRPELAQAALGNALGCGQEWIGVAGQETGIDWRQIT